MESNWNWKGGRSRHSGGYIVINIGRKQVLEHRLVMEKHLGRKLEAIEVVHHINGIKTDNRIENLHLESSNSEHFKKHHTGLQRNLLGQFIKQNA